MYKACKYLAVLAAVLVLAGSAGAGNRDQWLHIVVEEDGHRGETVRVNLPFQLLEALAPLIETGHSRHDDIWISGGRIHIHCGDFEDLDLRAMVEAVRDAPDAEYITVDSDYESVRVAKEKGNLLIRAEDGDETVKVTLRLDVIDEMLSEGENELDLQAMVAALGKHGEGEIVRVEGGDELVRIWVDSKSASD